MRQSAAFLVFAMVSAGDAFSFPFSLTAEVDSASQKWLDLLGFMKHRVFSKTQVADETKTKPKEINSSDGQLDTGSSGSLARMEERLGQMAKANTVDKHSSPLPLIEEHSGLRAKANLVESDSSELGVRGDRSVGRRARTNTKFVSRRLKTNSIDRAEMEFMKEMATNLDHLMTLGKSLINREKQIEQTLAKLQSTEVSTRNKTLELSDAIAKQKAREPETLMQLDAVKKQSAVAIEAVSAAKQLEDLTNQQSLQIESQKEKLATIAVELKTEQDATNKVAQVAYQIAQGMTQ